MEMIAAFSFLAGVVFLLLLLLPLLPLFPPFCFSLLLLSPSSAFSFLPLLSSPSYSLLPLLFFYFTTLLPPFTLFSPYSLLLSHHSSFSFSDRKDRQKDRHRDVNGDAPLPKAALDEEEIDNGDSEPVLADERMKELEDNQVAMRDWILKACCLD